MHSKEQTEFLRFILRCEWLNEISDPILKVSFHGRWRVEIRRCPAWRKEEGLAAKKKRKRIKEPKGSKVKLTSPTGLELVQLVSRRMQNAPPPTFGKGDQYKWRHPPVVPNSFLNTWFHTWFLDRASTGNGRSVKAKGKLQCVVGYFLLSIHEVSDCAQLASWVACLTKVNF